MRKSYTEASSIESQFVHMYEILRTKAKGLFFKNYSPLVNL